ncbi:DNA ligase [Dishui Lake large algae virus 1]|nr:DNA ligase [Dishui Lake large algae virus 1]
MAVNTITITGDVFEELQKNPEAVLTKMSPDDIASIIMMASDAYYNKGKPLVSDDMYDLVVDYLKKKDSKHPILQQIGAPIAQGDKVKLPYWMGSLDKIRDDPKALQKWLATYKDPDSYVVSDKLDGNSGLLVYSKDGVSLYSRGDGLYGQNVSHLIGVINGIPKAASIASAWPAATFGAYKPPFAVRGELIISRKKWEQIKDLGANARNVVAGAMHSKQPDSRIASRIDFVAYELLDPRTTPLKGFELMRDIGFMVADFKPLKADDTTMDRLSEILVSRRKDSPYEVDGIVIEHDTEHKRIKGKNPKYAFAFKSILTHDEAEVIVTRVEWNVSKDGYIKPIVHFPSVVIEGANISKATGFNAAFIEQHKIGPGSRIVIIRSGSVIPHIVRVVSASSNGKPSMPDMSYVWTDTHVDIVLKADDNESVSNEMMLKRMEYFVTALGLKGVGPGIIKKLFDSGYNTIPKLLAVKKDEVMKIEGFKTTSAQNIVNTLSGARQARCADLMAASGLFGRGVGTKKLAPVLEEFPNIANIEGPVPSVNQLMSIPGTGEATASAIYSGIVPFRKFLKDTGLKCLPRGAPRAPPAPSAPAPAPSAPASSAPQTRPDMSKINAVFTGFRSKEWENIVTDAGGKISTSVSKNTTMVVAADPDEDSSKTKKARELGIPIISKDVFAKKYYL